jgi:hypothetical protein
MPTFGPGPTRSARAGGLCRCSGDFQSPGSASATLAGGAIVCLPLSMGRGTLR